MSNFGARLRELRERQGMSQRDLDKATGWNAQIISDTERGKRAPPAADTIRKVALVLDVHGDNLDELLALAALERGVLERPLDLTDAAWAELCLELLHKARERAGGG